MKTSVRDRALSRSSDHRQILPTGLRPIQVSDQVSDQVSGQAAKRFVGLRHVEMSKLLLEEGRYLEALAQVEQALTLDPHEAESWCSRADALACLGRYEEALQSLEQAQELAGFGHVRLWVQKAVLLILLNRPRLALTCCNQALWRSPNHTQAWLFRGVALHRLGRCKAAYRSYQRVVEPATPSYANSIRRLCDDLALDHQAS